MYWLGRHNVAQMPAEPTSFLNVDLDLYASKPLDELVAAFGKSITVLSVGRHRRRYSAHLELGASGYGQSVDRIILGLVRMVEKLPPSQRAAWNAASLRQFNIGIQAGTRPPVFALLVKAKTIEAIARVGGDIVITVYAPDGHGGEVQGQPAGPGSSRALAGWKPA